MSTGRPAPAVWGQGHQQPPADLVSGIEQRETERQRLLGLCQQLQAGRSILTDELRRGGLAAFDQLS